MVCIDLFWYCEVFLGMFWLIVISFLGFFFFGKKFVWMFSGSLYNLWFIFLCFRILVVMYWYCICYFFFSWNFFFIFFSWFKIWFFFFIFCLVVLCCFCSCFWIYWDWDVEYFDISFFWCIFCFWFILYIFCVLMKWFFCLLFIDKLILFINDIICCFLDGVIDLLCLLFRCWIFFILFEVL